MARTDTNPAERLGHNLKAWRQARGLSLRAAAAEIGIAFSTLNRLERGLADFAVLRALEWMQSDAELDEWRARALDAERTLAIVQRAVHAYEDGPAMFPDGDQGATRSG